MEDFRDHFLKNPLSDSTIKARRNLLVVCATTFLVAKGFMPKKIEGLGLDVTQLHEKAVVTILTVLVVYYLVKFYVYMHMDGEAVVYKAQKALVGEKQKGLTWREFLREAKNAKTIKKYGIGVHLLVLVRSFIDVIFPLLVAIGTLYLLGSYHSGKF